MTFSARRFCARWNDAGVRAFMHASEQGYGICIIDHECVIIRRVQMVCSWIHLSVSVSRLLSTHSRVSTGIRVLVSICTLCLSGPFHHLLLVASLLANIALNKTVHSTISSTVRSGYSVD